MWATVRRLASGLSLALLASGALAASEPRPWLDSPEPEISDRDLERASAKAVPIDDGWPVSSPAAEGIDPLAIALLRKRIATGGYVGIESLVLARNGKLVSEDYFGGFDRLRRHQTRSTFKSVAGLLVGIAVGEGRLALDDRAMPMISRFHDPGELDRRKRRITVRDMLQMTSGLDCSEMPGSGPERESRANASDDNLAAHLAVPMAQAPGGAWRYCSSNVFLLGVALESALARDGAASLKDYLDSRLMNPLEISYHPAFSARGHLSMHGGERMRPRDLAKIGQLVVAGGWWQGRQLVPAEWIDAMISGGTETGWSWTSSVVVGRAFERTSSYRYLWFRTTLRVGERDFRLIHSWGNGGQFVVAVPELDLVVVTTGRNYGAKKIEEQKQVFHMLHRYVLPAVDRSRAR